jgi:cytochrome c-type biogenesis protein CcmH/NrfG
VKPRTLDTLLILLAGVLAYSNTFQVPFTFDDAGQIVASPQVRDLPMALRELPLAPRALGRLTFALDHAVHGLDVTGYHVVNLVIHLLTALAVWALARTALQAAGDADEARRRLAGLSAALLFVVHPLQTQAVTYVVQRYASLSTLLYVVSLLLYARSRLEADRTRSALRYAGSMLAALLAMRVKETAFTIPFALALYELLIVQGASVAQRIRRLAIPLLLLAVVPVLHLLAHAPGASPSQGGSAAMDSVARGGSDVSRIEYLLTQARVVVTYLRLLVLPVGQNVDHDYPLSRSLDLPVLASAVGLAALLGAGVWLTRVGRSRASPHALVAGFGILFFFLALSVESSFIPIRDLIAEHRVYLPSVGVFMAAGAGIAAGAEGLRRRSPRLDVAPAVALAALVLVLGVATWSRNQLWADPVALWSDAAAKSPGKLRPVLNWAGALRKRGDRQAALQVSLRGLSLPPTDNEEFLALGNVYRQIGDLRSARRLLEESLRLRPDFAHALMALGTVAWDEGNRVEAREHFQRAVEANPLLSGAHLKLAVALHETGEVERAYEEFELFVRYALPSEAAEAAQVARMLREMRAATTRP